MMMAMSTRLAQTPRPPRLVRITAEILSDCKINTQLSFFFPERDENKAEIYILSDGKLNRI